MSGNVKGQTNVYHPFPYSNAVWTFQNVDIGGNNGGAGCNGTEFCYIDYQYKFSGDTVFAGKKYAKISIYVSYANCPCGPGANQYVPSDYCAIRNDTLNKRVYSLGLTGSETLSYDFNKTVGDTFINCYSHIAIIDSVLIGGNYRKRFITSDSSKLIEGIGNVGMNTSGINGELFHSICGPAMSPNFNFVCYTDSIENYTLNSWYCLPFTFGIHENQNIETFIIYPNPFTSQTTISFSSKHTSASSVTHSIKVTNILGEQVFQSTINSKQYTLDMAGIAKGIYFVQITDGSAGSPTGNVVNRKIVVQ